MTNHQTAHSVTHSAPDSASHAETAVKSPVSTNRREVLKMTSAALALTSATVTAFVPKAKAAVNDPDSELYAALRRWQEAAIALKAQAYDLHGDEPNYEEKRDAFDEAVSAHDEFIFAALDVPAQTLTGLAVKCKAIVESRLFHDLGCPDFHWAAGASLASDIQSLLEAAPGGWDFPRRI